MFKIIDLGIVEILSLDLLLGLYTDHSSVHVLEFESVVFKMHSYSSLECSECDLTSREYHAAMNSSSLHIEFNQNALRQ